MRTPIFAANWKMNKMVGETSDFVGRLKGLLADGHGKGKAGADFEVVLGPSAVHLTTLISATAGTAFKVAAQNCGTAKFGAFTGEISPAVLQEVGVGWVIIGHSERRHIFKEDDALILSRIKAAVAESLKVIFCVGETLQDRKAGQTFKVIEKQLSILEQNQIPPFAFSRLVLAYEPVWAIGTGENATPQQAEEVHAFIRNWMAEKFTRGEADALRILYGGSVKPDNAAQIMQQKNVDGFLVGTSSLDPAVFAGVIGNALKAKES